MTTKLRTSLKKVYEHAGYVVVLRSVSNKAIKIEHDGFQQHFRRAASLLSAASRQSAVRRIPAENCFPPPPRHL